MRPVIVRTDAGPHVTMRVRFDVRRTFAAGSLIADARDAVDVATGTHFDTRTASAAVQRMSTLFTAAAVPTRGSPADTAAIREALDLPAPGAPRAGPHQPDPEDGPGRNLP